MFWFFFVTYCRQRNMSKCFSERYSVNRRPIHKDNIYLILGGSLFELPRDSNPQTPKSVLWYRQRLIILGNEDVFIWPLQILHVVSLFFFFFCFDFLVYAKLFFRVAMWWAAWVRWRLEKYLGCRLCDECQARSCWLYKHSSFTVQYSSVLRPGTVMQLLL